MENPAPKDAIPEGKWQVSEVPSGSTIGRGMCAEKRTNDRPEEGGTLNSGDPGAESSSGGIRLTASGHQRNEETARGDRESDLPIVVGDGRTDHVARRANHGRFDWDKEWGFGDGGHGEGGDIRIKSVEGGQKKGGGGAGRGGPGRPPRGLG